MAWGAKTSRDLWGYRVAPDTRPRAAADPTAHGVGRTGGTRRVRSGALDHPTDAPG